MIGNRWEEIYQIQTIHMCWYSMIPRFARVQFNLQKYFKKRIRNLFPYSTSLASHFLYQSLISKVFAIFLPTAFATTQVKQISYSGHI